jgi:protoporphyrin/coproporphyrin ferrochelatase
LTGTDYGVVLMNMGGPWSLDEIQPYLERVLGDRKLVRLPGGWLYQGLFARLVSRRRARKVVRRYELIGGGSPLLKETEVLAKSLSETLGVPVEIAMRYSTPYAADASRSLQHRAVQKWVGVPLYPQYSTSTSASSVDDFARQVPEGIDFVVLDRHFDNAGLHSSLLGGIRDLLAAPERPAKSAVLFTAHSIPTSYTAAGDPYVAEVEATAAALQRELGDEITTALAFQSAVKFGTWHGPDVEEVLPSLREQGVDGLIVQPLTFVSENLETLYDLDIVLRQTAKEAGFTWFKRGPAPGTNPAYVAGLAKAIARRAAVGRDDDA